MQLGTNHAIKDKFWKHIGVIPAKKCGNLMSVLRLDIYGILQNIALQVTKHTRVCLLVGHVKRLHTAALILGAKNTVYVCQLLVLVMNVVMILPVKRFGPEHCLNVQNVVRRVLRLERAMP